jgi:predicted RNA binding protein YcfA (HicA-like mRNA interferase family)
MELSYWITGDKMSKNDLLKINKYSDFTKAVISMGYVETKSHGGSHRIFKADGKPPLSIPCHNPNCDIAIGTRRNIIKLLVVAGIV